MWVREREAEVDGDILECRETSFRKRGCLVADVTLTGIRRVTASPTSPVCVRVCVYVCV